MSVSLVLKFYNQIYARAIELINTLASMPLAMEPESNKIIHQFEGLVLHVNHFAEKNNFKDFNGKDFDIPNNFRDLANSIKHIRNKPEEQVTIASAIKYEVLAGKFRFISNTITATYPNGKEFDAVENMCAVINEYLNILDQNRKTLEPLESKYIFYEWAFAYLKLEMAGLTGSIRLITVKKTADRYVKCDAERKYVFLYEHCIGKEPTQFFPDQSGNFVKTDVHAYVLLPAISRT